MTPARLGERSRRPAARSSSATPTLWRSLATNLRRGDLRNLRILVGGETLSGPLASVLRILGGEVTNLYGPTEVDDLVHPAVIGEIMRERRFRLAGRSGTRGCTCWMADCSLCLRG